jgi:hypothetical protein
VANFIADAVSSDGMGDIMMVHSPTDEVHSPFSILFGLADLLKLQRTIK